MSSLPDGEAKVEQCVKVAEVTLVNTGPQGREVIRQEADMLTANWASYQTDLDTTRARLEAAVGQWRQYDSAYDALLDWLKDMEHKLKEFGLVSTLDDKRAQLRKCQVGLVLFV